MLSACCFCIDLRVATLILAMLGVFSNLCNYVSAANYTSTHALVPTAIAFYSLFSAAACFMGLLGVKSRNVKFLSVFSVYQWFDLSLQFFFAILFSVVAFAVKQDVCDEILSDEEYKESFSELMGTDMNNEECSEMYIATASAIVIGLGISILLKLHYALAVYSYFLKVRSEQESETTVPRPVIAAYVPFFMKANGYQPVATEDAPPAYEGSVEVNEKA
ncbi:hypothetical protein BZG36_02407 [Bifiguratus adelaidae]|uniref:Uncharacterized protein n=1 Tax=Bifiguratus adelaidae TaxID=1938954 RepID=A0A261Y1B1_9FUNG|nr:hypothetical protein BZG36_02407 [Bifiguratus adelaidae]